VVAGSDGLPLPTGTLPTGFIPAGSIPAGSIPAGSIPVGTLPTGSIPAGTLCTGSAAGRLYVLEVTAGVGHRVLGARHRLRTVRGSGQRAAGSGS
jgi:hypothetical protein